MRWARRDRSSSSSGLSGSSGSDSTYRSGMGTFCGLDSCELTGCYSVIWSDAETTPLIIQQPLHLSQCSHLSQGYNSQRFYLLADVQVIVQRFHVQLSYVRRPLICLDPSLLLHLVPPFIALTFSPRSLRWPVEHLQESTTICRLQIEEKIIAKIN